METEKRSKYMPAPTHLAADCEAYIDREGGYCVAKRYTWGDDEVRTFDCLGCQEPMHRARSDSKTCSARCRQRYARATRAEREARV